MSVGVGFGVNLGGVGFLLDVVGQVTSQVNSEKALFSGSRGVGPHSGTQQNRPVLGAYRLGPGFDFDTP